MEWLAALAKSGRRILMSCCPRSESSGRTQSELREAILPCLGQRGHWLAAQNADWGYAATELPELGLSPDRTTQSSVPSRQL